MESLLSSTALPNLHAALVHFPIALLLVAFAVDVLAMVLRRRPWLARAAALLWALGALATIATYFAGRDAADDLGLVAPAVEAAIARHAAAAWWTLIGACIVGVLRVVMGLTAGNDARGDRRWVLRWLALVLGAMVVATVFVTADRGGALVYRHGVAVTAGAAASETAVASTPAASAHAALIHRDDGGLDWEPLPADYSVLQDIADVRALPGVLAADTTGAATETGLALQVNGRAFLLLPGSFGDVRVQADVDLAQFTGTVGVVHHYHDSASYEAFQVTGPTCGLVSYSGGKAKVLEEGTGLDSLEAAMISVSSAGEHIKGYIDERTAAHAHMEPPSPGRTGLFLDGQGMVVVHSMHVEPLAGE